MLVALTTSTPAGAASAAGLPSVAGSETSANAMGLTAKLKAPRKVVEGDRYTLHIKLDEPGNIRRIEVQQKIPDVFGDPVWETVKSLEARGRSSVKHRVVAGSEDRERFRVVLRPKSGRSVTSKVVTVMVWHWYPLSTWQSYYSTSGVLDSSYGQFDMNGRTYAGGWQTYGSYLNWESRYTLGRNCRSMRGTFGVTDESADGSSATLQILSEGTDQIYSSPALVPGSVDSKMVSLPTPYRISIIGTNTSPDGVSAFPAAGDLEFLCRGLD
jgi:hypothetical protein